MFNLLACHRRHKTLTLPHNSKTLQHIQLKLGTQFLRNNTHIYIKWHNSGFNNYLKMPFFFDLEVKQASVYSAELLFWIFYQTSFDIWYRSFLINVFFSEIKVHFHLSSLLIFSCIFSKRISLKKTEFETSILWH